MSRRALLLATIFSAAGPAWAQTPETADAPVTELASRDIIVTANRREERIVDVPFAITAIGQREIQDRGSIDIKDLQYSIPGLNIQELTPGANRITLRGINPGAGTGLPIVGIYVDEVGISVDQQQRDPAFPLVDLTRVEVLRGPQGTLYGQGSIAGTIRYITRDPDLNESGGFVEAKANVVDGGNIGYGVNGAIGVPLVEDSVGLRISGGYDRLPAWIDYPDANVTNANEQTRWFIRPKLLVKTGDLTLSLLYQYYDQRSDTDGITTTTDRGSRPGRTALYPGSDKSHLVNAIISYDMGGATLLSSTGFQERDLAFQAPFTPFVASFDTKFRQFSQELRISSNDEGPVQYVGGIWFRDFTSKVDRAFLLDDVITPIARRVGTDPVDSTSYAAFGDVTVSLNDKVDVSGGLRYYYDERSTSSTIPVADPISAAFRALSPRASVKVAWSDDVSSYATVSKGFRSGGFNGSGSSFGPESLWNYEVGVKAGLFGDALFFDIAAFYIDYSDRQANGLIELAPNVFLTETTNVGKASGLGLEGSFTARLGGGIELGGTAAYNNIKSDTTNAEVVKGQRFDMVPAFTASAYVSGRVPLGEASNGMWRLDYQYSDPYSFITRQGLPDGSVVTLEDFRNTSQSYLNARIGFERGPLGVYLDARNIFNEDALLFPNSPIASSNEASRPQPRTFQISLRYNFDR